MPAPSPALQHHELVAARLRAEWIALQAFSVQDVRLTVRDAVPARDLSAGRWEAEQHRSRRVIQLASVDGSARVALLVDLLAGGRFPLTPPVLAVVEAWGSRADLAATVDVELALWSPERSSLVAVLTGVARAFREQGARSLPIAA